MGLICPSNSFFATVVPTSKQLKNSSVNEGEEHGDHPEKGNKK